jgi:hypothetical protein
MKSYIKSKSAPNAAGLGYRTPDHFKGSIFSGGGKVHSNLKAAKFNPTQFRTQHKGG